jgi:hypothetical protein
MRSWFCLLLLPGLAASAQFPATRPAFNIVCGKAADTIVVLREDARTVLEVTCPSGIGSATITPIGFWPATVVLRLRLGGLESLGLKVADVRIGAEVQSHSGFGRMLVRSDPPPGIRPEIRPGDPLWMDIKAFTADGKPAQGLPGPGGWFEMTLPPALLQADAPLSLSWIDFFRG